MTRTAKKPEARSPYQKYGKTPYKYEFSNCKHSRSVYQSVPATANKDGWSGDICATCNVIVGRSDRRFRAEAA